jgi:hypothetical protein
MITLHPSSGMSSNMDLQAFSSVRPSGVDRDLPYELVECDGPIAPACRGVLPCIDVPNVLLRVQIFAAKHRAPTSRWTCSGSMTDRVLNAGNEAN